MKKLKYVVIGLGVMVAVTYGALAILLVTSSGTRVPANPGLTAREALPRAQDAASTWQADAQLVSASASWRGVDAEALLEDEEVSWGFAFFSPSTRSLAIFAVTAQSAGQVDSMDASPNTRTIEAGLWEVDSPQVLTTFLNHGGRELLAQDPQANVSLRLGPGEGDNSMAWLAIGISSDKQDTVTVQVDPGNGQVLAASP